MLSELQGVNRQINIANAAQARADVPTPVPNSEVVTPVAVATGLQISAELSKPQIQAPKHVEIKVDTEKMKAELQASLQKLNETLRDGGRNLSFNMDEKAGGLVILVKNADTGEVVRQIPNDVVVRIARNIEAFKGLLHNELS